MDYACTKKIFEGKLPISVLKKLPKPIPDGPKRYIQFFELDNDIYEIEFYLVSFYGMIFWMNRGQLYEGDGIDIINDKNTLYKVGDKVSEESFSFNFHGKENTWFSGSNIMIIGIVQINNRIYYYCRDGYYSLVKLIHQSNVIIKQSSNTTLINKIANSIKNMNPIFHGERVGILSHWGTADFIFFGIRRHDSDSRCFLGISFFGFELIVWNR